MADNNYVWQSLGYITIPSGVEEIPLPMAIKPLHVVWKKCQYPTPEGWVIRPGVDK
jgi:hypothetical protein